MEDQMQRLRHDLGVLQSATGLSLAFDRRDATRIGLCGLLGLPLVLWSLLGPTRPPIAGIAIVATLLIVLLVNGLAGFRADAQRESQPSRWRERKIEMVLFLALSAATLAYLLVAVWGGLSWNAATATAVFIGGVSASVPAITDRGRLHVLGGTLPTLIYAAVLPLADDRQLMLATGLWIVFAALGTTFLMRWQLKSLAPYDRAD